MATKKFRWEDVRDELCVCKHLKSEHGNTIARGHGSCTKCECGKFTWKSFVMAPSHFEKV